MSDAFNYGANERGTAARSMAIDDWVNYSGSGSGGGKYLSWKKDGRGDVTIWLHCNFAPQIFWHHNWPLVQEVKDKEGDGKHMEVWGSRWGCHDAQFEQVLKKRNFRDKSTGEREYPPVRDPLCKLIELVHREVWAGNLSWIEPVFQFEGDDPTQTRVMLAGGLYNAFNDKNLTPAQRNELRKAGVRQDESWQQDVRAKCSFLMVCAIDGQLEEGLKIAIEGEALKNEMKRAIETQRKQRRDKVLSPLANPYPFRWEYDQTQEFSKRYIVTPLNDEPTDEILAAIKESEPPDTSEITVEGDPDALLASVEEHALIKLDWGSCFKVEGKTSAAVPATITSTPKVAPHSTSKAGPPPSTTGGTGGGYSGKAASPPASKPIAAQVKAAPVKLYTCEHCGKAAMKGTDFICPHCGAAYEEIAEGGQKQVVMTARPCTKCKTPIVLSASPQTPGEAGENVICEKCGTIHHEVCVAREVRPCENPKCTAEVALDAGAECGHCGKVHELGEEAPEAAPVVSWQWTAVEPEKPAAAATPSRRARR